MVNVVCGIRSTGRICTDLADALQAQGHQVKIAYGRETVPVQYEKYAVRIGTDFGVKAHAAKARLFDACGSGSRRATEHFIDWVKEYDPDVIHLHNLHGYYINVEVLFRYLKTCGKRIIWTLHDCWAFTGHAAYCEYADCERWKTGCFFCPKKKDYPRSFTDNSRNNWVAKKRLFSGIPKMQLVTPSNWLAGLVGESFLSEYPVCVINNGIDINVFRPVQSSVRERLGTGEKKVVLGVAALWEDRKGLKDLIALADMLGVEYQIILVGLSKKQIDALPKGIIGIERTDSVEDLAELYSAADVYVNPTYEDNYPTTNIEAIACGTPVVTYSTGGSPESARLFGIVINKGNLQGLSCAVRNAESIIPADSAALNGGAISLDAMLEHYLDLYNRGDN